VPIHSFRRFKSALRAIGSVRGLHPMVRWAKAHAHPSLSYSKQGKGFLSGGYGAHAGPPGVLGRAFSEGVGLAGA
jgi:hypothetical protein